MPKSNVNDSHPDPYDSDWMGESPDGLDPFLGTSFEQVVQKHDYVYQLIVHNTPEFTVVFGLNYHVHQMIAMRLAGVLGHALVPDVTMLVSNTPGDSWEQVKQRADPEERFNLANTELVKNLDRKRDADQVWSNLMAFRGQLGRHFNLIQTIVVTDPPPPSVERPKRLTLSGAHTSGPQDEGVAYAGIVYIDECLAANLPESVLRTPFGAAGALLCKDGLKEKYLRNAFHLWHNNPELMAHRETFRFWIELLELRPQLRELYAKFVQQLIEEEIITMEPTIEDLYASESALLVMNTYLSFLPDPTRLERVRELIQQENLRGKRAVERAAKQAAEQATNRATQQTHTTLLLRLLRKRGIELSPQQRAQLKRMKCEELPDIGVADDAKDAEDFARMANLPVGE